MAFDGFTDSDFDTYRPDHRTSAKYTLARRLVRDRLKLLMTDVQALLGPDAAGLELCFSSEVPSLENNRSVSEQGAWLIRSAADQLVVKALVEKMSLRSTTALDVAPFHKHAALGVVVDEDGVRVLCSFHPRGTLDRQNLKARLNEGWAQEAWIKMMQALDGTFLAQMPGMLSVASAPSIGMDQVVEAAKQLDLDGALVISHQWPRPHAQGQIQEKVVSDLRALLPVYRFGVWAPDNDHVQAVKAAKQVREEARKPASTVKAGDKVRITTGLWNGKMGVVQEVDRKGVLRVMVGAVSVKVEPRDAQPL